MLDRPNLDSPQESSYRRKLLGEFRGWGRDQSLLRGFPSDIMVTRLDCA